MNLNIYLFIHTHIHTHGHIHARIYTPHITHISPKLIYAFHVFQSLIIHTPFTTENNMTLQWE